MTYSITLPARDIPDGETVFKVNGAKPYTLKFAIRMFTKGEKGNAEITPAPGSVYIMAEGDINQIPDSTPLRVDFEDAADAAEFLTEISTSGDDR